MPRTKKSEVETIAEEALREVLTEGNMQSASSPAAPDRIASFVAANREKLENIVKAKSSPQLEKLATIALLFIQHELNR